MFSGRSRKRKRRSTNWKTRHAASGATTIERRSGRCRLAVMPLDWTSPRGPAAWTATCGKVARGGNHKRGRAKTITGAKSAATRAVNRMRR